MNYSEDAAERRERLDAWWLGLSDTERAELLPLEEGEALPSGLSGPPLAQALGSGSISVPSSDGDQQHIVIVDAQLGGFLTDKRAETGGG